MRSKVETGLVMEMIIVGNLDYASSDPVSALEQVGWVTFHPESAEFGLHGPVLFGDACDDTTLVDRVLKRRA